MDTDKLIRRGLELRCSIDSLKKQLEDVNRQIIEAAEFPEGKSTAWVQGKGCRARVVNRVYEKWDQHKLDEARRILGEQAFDRLFHAVWEPVSRREVQGFLSHATGEEREALLEALDAKTSPMVSYEVKGGGLSLGTRLFGLN